MILLATTAWLAQATPMQDWRVVHERQGASIAVQVGPEWATHRRGMVAILVTLKTEGGSAQTWREVAMSCTGQPSTVTYVQMRREVPADPSVPLNVTMTDEYPPYMGQAYNSRSPIHVAIGALCSSDGAPADVIRTSWADILTQQREAVTAQ